MLRKNLTWIIQSLVVLASYQQVTSQDSCNNTWLTRPGAYIPGGSYDSSSYSVLQCRDSCLRFSNCVGFDFDGANRCWIIFGGTIQRDPNNYITHYELYRGVHSCNASCTNGNGLAMREYKDSHVNGGSYTSDQTFAACVTKCGGESTCRGFDWDPQNPYKLYCWINGFSRNPIQADSPGVNHYEKECTANGISQAQPNFIPYDQQTLPPSYSTVPTVSRPAQTVEVEALAAGDPIHLQQTGIKPAYIVLIGLGGGCILLTFIAVVLLCMYPFKGNRSGGGGYSKTKKTKTTTTTTTHRPKSSSSQEQIGMSTVTAVHASRESYDQVSYDDNHRNTHVSNGSANNDEYNRSNGGGSVRHSTQESRQSAYHQDDYDTRNSGGSQQGFQNEGYNTINSNTSKRSGYANEGYNSMNSKKSGYEEHAYDRDSTLER